jgi:hypothetical protein
MSESGTLITLCRPSTVDHRRKKITGSQRITKIRIINNTITRGSLTP